MNSRPLAEAARYLRLAPATLRSWVLGRPYPTAKDVGQFRPLIHPPDRNSTVLSFWNLIEAHVLRSLRTEHGVALRAVRASLDFAQRSLQLNRLLLSPELRTDAGQIFLDRYGHLISLSASGQLALRRLFDEHLKRIEWDAWRFPVRLYPFLQAETLPEATPIVIDPAIAFGRPILIRRGVSTSAIAARIDAGEQVSDLASPAELAHNPSPPGRIEKWY